MNEEDKQDISVKPASQPFLRNRFIKYGLLLVVAIIILIWLCILAINNLPSHKSKKLLNTISQLENGHHQCKEGLRQVGSVGSKLAAANGFTNDAREKGLSYVMACTFITGNTKQAQTYADQLSMLYKQDGNKSAQKLQQLTDFMIYMKNYRH